MGDVGDGGEDEVVGCAEVALLNAAHTGGHFETPATCGEVGQAQHDRLARGVPAHAFGVEREIAVRAGGDEAVVPRVEHRGQTGAVVTGRTCPHRLVEADRELAQRQGHQGAIGHAGRDDLGRLDWRKFVDALGLGDQHAAVRGGDDALASGAAFSQLERALGGQLDGPDGAGVGHRAATCGHSALRRVCAGQQQTGEARAGLAEGEAVHQAGDAVFQLGAAFGAAGHGEADDVGGGLRQGRDHVRAGPAHGPQAPVGPEGEVAHAAVAEVRPGRGRVGRLGIEDLDAVATGHVDQAAAGLDGQRVGERLASRRAGAADDGAAGGVHEQQFRAGHDPEVTDLVERHVEHGAVQAEQRLYRAAALFGEAQDLVALSPGAGQHAAVEQLDHGERADVGLAGRKAAGKAAQLQGCEHGLQVGPQATQGRSDDEAGQALRRLGEEIALDVAAARGGGGQLCRGVECVGHAQGELGVAAAAVVGQHGVADAGGLAVASVVGGHGQEPVALAGHAGEECGALGAGGLLLPDLEVATVFGDVDGDVLDAAGVVKRRPVELEAGVAACVVAAAGDGEGGERRVGVQGVADRGAGNRRGGVEEDAGRGREHGAGGGERTGADGVADESTRGLAVGIGRQQAALRVAQHLAGVGVDGLDQPGGDVAFGINAGTDAQHISLGAREIEVALEDGLPVGDVDVDVAEFEVAQAQAAHVEIRIDGRHQTDFSHRRLGRVVEAERVGQRVVCGDVGGAIGRRQGLRAAHADRGARVLLGLGGLLQVAGEVEGLRADRTELAVEHADVAQVLQLGAVAGKHIEADEVGVLPGVLVVVRRVGGHGHGDVDLGIFGAAHLLVVHRRVRGARVSGELGAVAVPLLDLAEEAQQVGLGAVVVAGLGQQDTGGQRGVEAEHQRIGPDRRGGALGAQQAGGLQRGQPALGPLGLVCRQHSQGVGRGGVGQDGGAQRLGVRGLRGDELIAGERGDGSQGVEAEGHGQRFFLGDVLLGVGGEELLGQTLGDLVQAGDALVEDAAGLPGRVVCVELGAQALEVVVEPLGQAGVGLHLEAGAGKAVCGEVEGIARGEVPAQRVLGAIERGPGHIGAHAGGGGGAVALGVAVACGNRAVGLAADVGAEHDVGQVQPFEHVLAVAHVAGADVEAHVGRVDVGEALQADAVERGVTGVDGAGAAHADGHVGLDHAFNQVAVGLDDALAVGVGHEHVVQAQGHVAQVEHGADVGGVQHLPARGLDLELARARQLHQRARRETGTFNVHGDPAVVVVTDAALIRRDLGDGQRQQVGAQADRRGRSEGSALARTHQDVVVAGLGGGHEQGLVGRDGVAVGHVEDAAGGHVVPADVDLVGAGGGGRVEQHAQGFAGSDADLVDQGLVFAERGLQGLGHREQRHLHIQRGARGAAVVGLAGGEVDAGLGVGDAPFKHLVVEVGPHDHAPRAVLERGQVGLEAAAVAAVAGHVAHVGDLAELDVAEVPGVVGREVERVGPAAVGRVDRVVADGELDLDLVAHLGSGRQGDMGDHQVGRRRGFDAHRLHGRGAVVVVLAELEHLTAVAAAPDAGGVGHHEDVVRPFKVARCSVGEAAGVAAACGQAAAVLDVAEVAVLVEVEEAVLGEVDHVVPVALVGRGLAAEVLDLVGDREVLAGNDAVGRGEAGDLQVGRGGQRHRQGDLRDVVGLVLELQHAVAAALADDGQAGAHGAGDFVVEVFEHAGVGLDDELEGAADRGRDREGGALGVALAGLQIPRFALGVGQVDLAGTQQHLGVRAPVHQRGVAGVERGVAREVDAVEPARHAGGAGAPVGDGPGGGDRVARAGVGLVNRDRVDLQIGLAVDDVELARAEVVVALGALEDRAGVVAVAAVDVVVAVGRGRRGELVL